MPDIPDAAERVWEAFIHLAARRSATGDPISFVEIEAYTGLMGVPLRPWEVEAICDMDNAYLAGVAKRRTPQSAPDDAEPRMKPATRENILAAFDRLRATGKTGRQGATGDRRARRS